MKGRYSISLYHSLLQYRIIKKKQSESSVVVITIGEEEISSLLCQGSSCVPKGEIACPVEVFATDTDILTLKNLQENGIDMERKAALPTMIFILVGMCMVMKRASGQNGTPLPVFNHTTVSTGYIVPQGTNPYNATANESIYPKNYGDQMVFIENMVLAFPGCQGSTDSSKYNIQAFNSWGVLDCTCQGNGVDDSAFTQDGWKCESASRRDFFNGAAEKWFRPSKATGATRCRYQGDGDLVQQEDCTPWGCEKSSDGNYHTGETKPECASRPCAWPDSVDCWNKGNILTDDITRRLCTDLSAGKYCFKCQPGSHRLTTNTVPNPTTRYIIDDINVYSLCAPCPKGKYQDENAIDTECKECPQGQYNDKIFQKQCTKCPRGEYQDEEGQRACSSCPSGRFSNETGTTSCTYCPAGRYSDEEKQIECTSCPNGQYQDNAEQNTGCKICSSGQYSLLNETGGTSSCTKCLPGQYNSDQGLSSCEECNRGKYQNNRGSTTCIFCEVGRFNNISGSTGCTHCGAGYYQDELGQTLCKSCPKGKFGAEEELRVCKDCLEGKYTDTKNSTVCKGCEPGKSQPNAGKEQCMPCSPGRYQILNSSTSCTKCLQGRASSEQGRTVPCKDCVLGLYQNEDGKSLCDACPTGRKGMGDGETECALCPAGKYNDELGRNTTCKICALGTVQARTGRSSQLDCSSCTKGRYGNAKRDECIECDTGKFNDADSQSNCKNCSVGRYQNEMGKTICKLCNAGKYASEEGGNSSESACNNCPLGSLSAAGASSCTLCIEGKYSNANHDACLFCERGYFSNYKGRDVLNTSNGNCDECNNNGGSQEFPISNRTACTKCNPGRYMDLDNNQCKNCTGCTSSDQVGQFLAGCSGSSKGVCTLCDSNANVFMSDARRKSLDYERFSACDSCPECPLGTERVGHNSSHCGSCNNCTEGFYSDMPNGRCKSCDPENNTEVVCADIDSENVGCNTTYKGECQRCKSGKYRPRAKKTCENCQSCEKNGEYREGCGGEFEGTCEPCAFGKYRDASSNETKYNECSDCLGCPPGMERRSDSGNTFACAKIILGIPENILGTRGKCTPCKKNMYKTKGKVDNATKTNNWGERCQPCSKCKAGQARIQCGLESPGTCVNWRNPIILSTMGSVVGGTAGGSKVVIKGKHFVGYSEIDERTTKDGFEIYYGVYSNLKRLHDMVISNVSKTTTEEYVRNSSLRIYKIKASTCILEGFETALAENVTKQIVCETEEGIGRNHFIFLTLYGRVSNLFEGNISYTAPIMTDISYVLESSAQTSFPGTEGGTTLKIAGKNFGPDCSFAYGKALPVCYEVNFRYGTNLEYAAADCRIQSSTVLCKTVKGVGKNLAAQLTIGDQLATQPTITYARPTVRYIGIAADGSTTEDITSANTDGGEIVYVSGDNFGPMPYSFGDGDVEFSDSNLLQFFGEKCNITESSTKIRCFSPAGVGRDLVGRVTVSRQTSDASQNKYGYGAPNITHYTNTIRGITSPNVEIYTSGSNSIELFGQNFATLTDRSKLDASRPVSIYYRYVYDGYFKAHDTTFREIFDVQIDGQKDKRSLRFTPPPLSSLPIPSSEDGWSAFSELNEGIGISIMVGVEVHPAGQEPVKDIYQGSILIPFGGPQITAARKPPKSSVGRYLITIEGQNFCEREDANGIPNCGAIIGKLNDDDFCAANNRLLCEGITDSPSGAKFIFRSWTSTAIVFETPAKYGEVRVRVGKRRSNITKWNEGVVEFGELHPASVTLETNGTGTFTIVDCMVNGDQKQNVEIVFGSVAEASQDCSMFPNNRCPICTESGDQGCTIKIESPTANIRNTKINITVTKAPVGQGLNIPIFLRYEGFTAGPKFISYGKPEIFEVTLQSSDSNSFSKLEGDVIPAKGAKITIRGSNLGIFLKSNTNVGTPGSLKSKAVFFRNGFNQQILSCEGEHTIINCSIPPGNGTGYELDLDVSGQTLESTYSGFGFKLPSLEAVHPNRLPTTGSNNVIVSGANLCSSCNAGSSSFANLSVYMCPPTIKDDWEKLLKSNCTNSALVSANDTHLRIQVGEGGGRDYFLVIRSGYSDPVATNTKETMLSYDEPSVFSITPNKAPTNGGQMAKIRGKNFGPSDSKISVIFLGSDGVSTVLKTAYHNHTDISFEVPEGQGLKLSLLITVGPRGFTVNKTFENKFSYDIPELNPISSGVSSCENKPNIADLQNMSVDAPCITYINEAGCNADKNCEWVVSYPTSGCDVVESTAAWRTRLRQNSGDTNYARRCEKKAEMVLNGKNFGTRPLKAYLVNRDEKEKALSIVKNPPSTHVSANVIVPPGYGSGFNVKLEVEGYGDKGKIKLPRSTVRYKSPYIESVMLGESERIDARGGGQELTLKGTNLGSGLPADTNDELVQIYIDHKQCKSAKWHAASQEDGYPYLTCNFDAEVLVGPLAVAVDIATLPTVSPGLLLSNSITNFYWGLTTYVLRRIDIDLNISTLKNSMQYVKSTRANAICKAEGTVSVDGKLEVYHGAPGELCAKCPDGAVCELDSFSDPLAKKGYYRMKLDITKSDSKDHGRAIEQCQKRRLLDGQDWAKEFPGIGKREYCYEFANCFPPEACKGMNQCTEGYNYNLLKCQQWEEEQGKRTKCYSHNDCRTRSGRKDGSLTCSKDHPEDCARCVTSEQYIGSNITYDNDPLTYGLTGNSSNSGVVYGYCECEPSPRCELCSEGTHFRLDNKCEPCPGNPVLLLVLVTTAIIVAISVAYYLNKRNFNLAFLSIGVDYFQVVALFTSADVAWPPEVKEVLKYLRLFNIDLDVMAPECAIPDFDYELKWWATMLTPLIALGIITFIFIVAECVSCLLSRKGNKTIILDTFISCFIVIFYYGYIILIKRGMEIFDCSPRKEKPDGVLYTKFVSVKCDNGLCRCYDPEHLQYQLFPYALVFVGIYSVLFPVVLFIFLRCNKVLIKQDQLLRAAETGNTPETNKDAYHIRKRYSQMYYHFRPGKIYWIIYILLRKGSIAIVGLMLRGVTAVQLCVTVLILFWSYLMQVKHNPYMSTSQRLHVLADHKLKCKEGDEKHMYMEMRIKQALEFKMKQKEGRRLKRRRLSAIGKGLDTIKNKTFEDHHYFFNFNSVEQTLLTSAILVCMAGIIFVSDGMKNPITAEQKFSKVIIAYVVGGILAFSIVYYGVVFVSEVAGYTPKWLMKIFSDKKSHMHREFEKHSIVAAGMTVNPIHNGENMKGGDIEMVVSGKSSSLQEKHFKKLLGENDILKQKLEKQRKYTEELKKSVHKQQQAARGAPSSRGGPSTLREGIKTRKKMGKKRSFKQRKARIESVAE